MRRPRVVGGLSRRLSLLQPSRVGDGGGGAAITYAVVASVWAEVVSKSAGEAESSDNLVAQATHTIRIRWRSDVRAGWRADLDGRTFRVRGALDPDADKRWLQLDCEEEMR